MIRALVLDLDGTLVEGGRLLPGAALLLGEAVRRGIPFVVGTNTTSTTASHLSAGLSSMGLPVPVERILTPAAVLRGIVADRGIRNARVIRSAACEAELAGVVGQGPPELLVLAEEGEGLDVEDVNEAMRLMLGGVETVALQRNRYYRREGRLVADTGFWVAGLEYVTGRTVPTVGKPSKAFFDRALALLGNPSPGLTAVVGDDVEVDARGPKAHGLRGILVRTGKYRSGDEDRCEEPLDAVIDGLADLVPLLG